MRDKKFLIAAVIGLFAMILLLVILLIPGSGGIKDTSEDEELPFGETGDIREIPLDTITAEGSMEDLSFGEQKNENEAPSLRVLSNVPVIGATIYSRELGPRVEQFARYTERGTGRILDTPLRIVENPIMVTDTSLSRIGRVLWDMSGNTLVVQRYSIDANDMSTYVARLVQQGQVVADTDNEELINTSPSKGVQLDGRLLSSRITDLAIQPSGDSVFFLEYADSGVTGYLESTNMEVRRSIWSSPLRSLTVSWDAPQAIVIHSNPSSVGDGVVWVLDPSTGASKVVLAKELALAARTDRSGTRLLYSFQEAVGSARTLRLLELTSAEIKRAPITTIVEKCVWGTVDADHVYCAIPGNLNEKNYLENWYMGIVESKDVIVRWNVRTGAVDTVLNPEELTKRTFDIVDMVISPQEDFIVFRTKNNSILWSARIPEHLQPRKKLEEQETESL